MTTCRLTAVRAAVRSARVVGAAVLIMSLAMLSLPGCAPAPPVSVDQEGNGGEGDGGTGTPGTVAAPAGERWFPDYSVFLLAPDGRQLALIQDKRLVTFAVDTADELLDAAPSAVVDLSGLGDASESLRPVAWCEGREGPGLLVAGADPEEHPGDDHYYFAPLDANSAPRSLADEPLWCSWAFAPGATVDVAAVRQERGDVSFAYCSRPLDGLDPSAWQPAWSAPAGSLLRYVRLATPTVAVAETYSERPVDAGGYYEESHLWRIDLTVDGAGAVQRAVAELSSGLDYLDHWCLSPGGDAIVALGFRGGDPRGSLVRLSGAEPVDLGPCDVFWAGWSPDGRRVCYRTYEGQLRYYDLDLMTGRDVPYGSYKGGSESRAMPLGEDRWLLWDGTRMAVIDGRTGETSFIARYHNSDSLQLTRDGSMVAFVDGEAKGLRLVSLAGRP